MPRVVKSNDVREPFNEEKLRSGMLRALEKRPVSSDDVETDPPTRPRSDFNLDMFAGNIPVHQATQLPI